MKNIIDNFSLQSHDYKKFRPGYPSQLFNEIYKYLACKNYCLDCGTGNGQIAHQLSDYFNRVYAVDISTNQLGIAIRKKNIFYFASRSERTPFRDNLFDLITASQAVHWFDIQRFSQEVVRLSVNKGIVALIGYGLVKIDPETDEIIEDFYKNTMGEYWDAERKLVDNEYEEIELDLECIVRKRKFFSEMEWSLENLIGYLNSWSSVQKYIKEKGGSPVSIFESEIKHVWLANKRKKVRFPIFIKLYRVHK